jgi:hypothetical protein
MMSFTTTTNDASIVPITIISQSDLEHLRVIATSRSRISRHWQSSKRFSR